MEDSGFGLELIVTTAIVLTGLVIDRGRPGKQTAILRVAFGCVLCLVILLVVLRLIYPRLGA